MGTSTTENGAPHYSVPEESHLPGQALKYASKIKFEGSDMPSIPINWRFAESISALKALEGTMVNQLLVRKYRIQPQEIVINTDHAQLFIMSTLLWTIDPEGDKFTLPNFGAKDQHEKMIKYFPSWDIHRQTATHHRNSATNIYKTKDRRFFHLHGSMNPDPTLESIGLPYEMDAASVEESWKPFMEKIAQIDSKEMQRLASDVYRQAGTICWTADEYRESEHGKANAHVGLFEIHEHPNASQPPSWWPEAPNTSANRPLAGLKVVDITRVIAAPAIGRGLAELGASVMRVTAPHLVDFSSLHCDLNWGKWNTCLDFRKEEDRLKLRELILEADVIIQGYRPGVLEKWGLSRDEILSLCKDRGRGIIFARENCYGWNGPWAYRSGWQQISDACCGVSMAFGQSMGNDEPVTPVFPNSDYCTGVAGIVGIIESLLRRGEKGGSYTVDVALNYYSRWLVDSCGVYPDEVWQNVWSANGKKVFRHYHNMLYTIPALLDMLYTNSKDKLFNPKFFHDQESKNLGVIIRTVKPVLQFTDGNVELRFNVGTRTNGVDQPRWPEDLLTEVVRD